MFIFSKNQKIGDYEVVFPHKEGKYAQTYRVKDREGKVKFLKLISIESLEKFQFDDNGLVIEAEVSLALEHENLCRCDEVKMLELDGKAFLYIVTEYVRGENLSDRLFLKGRYCFSLMEVRQIMSALLSTLDYIHTLDRPVIHNEVTLENILLDTVGNLNNLKLIDFGAARFADQKPDPASWADQNLYYVAPERMEGEGSVRSDIFSAGVVLYRLIFGVMPWETNLEGMSLQEQVHAIQEKRSEPLSLPNVQIMEMDNNLLKVMLKALSPDPDQRFATAREFFEALKGTSEVSSAPLSMTRVWTNGEQPAAPEKKGNGFADVAGMDDIKDIMKKKIINILQDPEKAERFKIQIPNGMLLYGPPGCGKSFIAEKFAEEAGFNYVFVKSSDLASIYVHGSQEKIGTLFEEARKNAPTILNFDEFEALVPDRSKVNNTSESGEVNEFLSQLNNCGKDRVFVIASTNRPDLIDPAILRKGRIDNVIFIPLPDKRARQGIFEIHMHDRPSSANIDYARLADLTENFVASDIAYIVNDAAIRAFDEDSVITQELLEEVIRENNPSISQNDIRFYEGMRKAIESKGREPEPPRIGFHP